MHRLQLFQNSFREPTTDYIATSILHHIFIIILCIVITRLILSDSKCCGPPKPKRAKRQCHFDPNWPQQYPGIGRSYKGN